MRHLDLIQKLLEVMKTPNKSNPDQKPNHQAVRPVKSEQPPCLLSQLEEIDIDFRVSGLPHAVEKEAEHLRVQELVKKIESHPHREALQADLKQNHIHKPLSNNSKEKIDEMGNVELFKLCETLPKVQCSQCFLYWNQGIVCCTCGHFLVESESSQKFNKLRLDALSIPHNVIKKGRPHGAQLSKTEAQKQYHIAFISWKRCRKRVDGQEEHYEGIHDRFLRDQVFRESSLKIGWTEQKCIEMDKLAQEDHSNRHSREEFKRYQGQWYLTLNNRAKLHRCDFDQTSELQSQSKTVSIENQAKNVYRPISFQQYQRWHPSSSSDLVDLMSSIHF